jgi:hypothetical protein
VLSVKLCIINEENHDVLKGPMTYQWGTKLHVINCVVKWNYGKLVYNCVRKMILKEFSYNIKCDCMRMWL